MTTRDGNVSPSASSPPSSQEGRSEVIAKVQDWADRLLNVAGCRTWDETCQAFNPDDRGVCTTCDHLEPVHQAKADRQTLIEVIAAMVSSVSHHVETWQDIEFAKAVRALMETWQRRYDAAYNRHMTAWRDEASGAERDTYRLILDELESEDARIAEALEPLPVSPHPRERKNVQPLPWRPKHLCDDEWGLYDVNDMIVSRSFTEEEARLICESVNASVSPHVERWQDIETAPKDGSGILVYFPQIGVWHVSWSTQVFEDGFWCVSDNKFEDRPLRGWSHEPTHWMPLPVSPHPQKA